MNFADLISSDTTIDSEHFLKIVSRKQKSHLSELKTAILQRNDLYFCTYCTKMWIKLSVWAPLCRGESKVGRRRRRRR